MFDARQLLDALVGATAKRLTGEAQGVQGGQGQGQNALSHVLDQLFGAVQGGPADPYVQKAKAFVDRNPRLAEAALMAVAGALTRRAGGIGAGAARLGGLALIGALAYKAYQSYQTGEPLRSAQPSGAGATPSAAAFDPAAATDDDALRFARAMVAAATADGRVDNNERARITKALAQAGIDPRATRWLEDELASPATVDDLAAGIETPEKGAQVYAAARLAIDPDTIQEREFLRQLALSLDLDQQLARQIDDTTASLRA